MDPRDGAIRWHRWSVSGPVESIPRVVAAIDATLSPGWRRVTGDELLAYKGLVRTGAGWYALSPSPGHVGVTLSVEPHGGTELRGGRVWFAGPPHTGRSTEIPATWDEINHLLDQIIVPAAQSAGARFQLPDPNQMFLEELSEEVQERLLAFLASARKVSPLDRGEAGLWHEFVVAAFRTKATVDARRFIAWLVSNGWPDKSAQELALKFFDDCLLLAKYTDRVPVA